MSKQKKMNTIRNTIVTRSEKMKSNSRKKTVKSSTTSRERMQKFRERQRQDENFNMDEFHEKERKRIEKLRKKTENAKEI